MTVLAESLAASARDFLQRALRSYTDGDWPVVLPFAGIGLEHLCKAYLAGLHPTLIAERGSSDGQHFDSLLHLLGSPHSTPASRVRTVGGYEALRRLRQVLPAAQSLPVEAVRAVFDGRSETLHLGAHDQPLIRERLSVALRLGDIIFVALDVDASERWGDHADIAATVIDETIAAAKQETVRLIARAKANYALLVSAHPTPEGLQEAVKVLEQRWVRNWRDAGLRGDFPCPGCGHQGQVAGRLEYDDDEPFEYGGEEGPPLWAQHLAVEEFACPVCGLRLEGPDGLEAAGVDRTVEWESTSEPPTHYLDWEPDEDWLRGR